MPGSNLLPGDFRQWLADHADAIDAGTQPAADILPRLVASGVVGAGVPVEKGGAGGTVVDAVQAIAAVAEESLAAAFVLWGHRGYIEYVLQSPNRVIEDRHLADLLAGRVAGASGLSNAMKSLAGLETLQITARRDGDALVLDGRLPWVTNLRPAHFHVAAAVDRADGGPAFVAFLDSKDVGLTRSPDLDLMAMRSSDTAALTFAGVRIDGSRILADDAADWLCQLKPSFVGLQCGMSIGLARRALAEAGRAAASGRHVLAGPVGEQRQRLHTAERELADGLLDRRFEEDASALFELRIRLADIVAQAVQLELQAAGGKAYLAGPGHAFARRWRESAFVPLVTPSLTQMQAALLDLRQAA